MTEYRKNPPKGQIGLRRKPTGQHSNGSKSKGSPLTGRRRGWILFVGVATTIFCGLLIYTLYDLQIKQYEYYSQLASQQHWKRIVDQPQRGDILDVNGNVLASTTYVYTVGITPKGVKSRTKPAKTTAQVIAKTFAETLGIDEKTVTEAMAKTDASYVQLAKNVSKEQIDKFNAFIKDESIGGVTIDTVAQRYYVNHTLASQLLGVARDEGTTVLKGQFGLESEYNQELTGKEGYSYVEVDNYSRGALPYSAPTSIAVEDGYNVVLNVDKTIQGFAEKACADVYSAYDVIEGVTAIVMNPYEGSVLAMASYPNFDPNDPTAAPSAVDNATWSAMSEKDQLDFIMKKAWRNRAISDTYEPGSTFKALTTAMALEEGITSEDTEYRDEPIKITALNTIHCWMQTTDGTNHQTETLKKAFENSCNPVFAQLAIALKVPTFYKYVHNFGFYDPTGIDLPQEGVGIFHKDPMEVNMATLSYGMGSTVTPIQMINTYCALVNGGTLMVPRVAKELTDGNGNIVKEFLPEKIRTVFSETTAARVRELMKGVVTEGTGTAGYVEGYNVAGKTSTAVIVDGKYEGYHVLSFGGYAPSDNPKIVVLVVVNLPGDKKTGSESATKAVADIISQTLKYMDVQPEYTEDDYTKLTTKLELPNVVGKTYKKAKDDLYLAGFIGVDGEENMDDNALITEMFPAAGTLVYKNAQVILYTKSPADAKQVIVPDFTGKDITECMEEARLSDLNVVFTGDPKGRCVSQTPTAYLEPAGTATITPGAGETGGEPGTEEEPAATPSPTPTASPTPVPTQSAEPGTGGTPTPTVTDSPVAQRTRVPVGTIIEITME